MSDKTCGTCQRLETHRAPLYGRYFCFYNVSITSNGVEIPEPRSEDDAACESWIERTDSLEQWARDMLIFLDNDEGAFCEHCVGNGEGCYGEYLCATMAEARNNFLVRLKALGVES